MRDALAGASREGGVRSHWMRRISMVGMAPVCLTAANGMRNFRFSNEVRFHMTARFQIDTVVTKKITSSGHDLQNPVFSLLTTLNPSISLPRERLALSSPLQASTGSHRPARAPQNDVARAS